jgi:hypothetical protein
LSTREPATRSASGSSTGPAGPPPPHRDRRPARRPRRRAVIADQADRHRQRRRPAHLSHVRRPGRVRTRSYPRTHPRRPRRRPGTRTQGRPQDRQDPQKNRAAKALLAAKDEDGRHSQTFNDVAQTIGVSRSTIIRHCT